MPDSFDRLFNFLSKIEYDPFLPQYKENLFDKEELKQILSVGKQFFYISDLSDPKIVFISDSVEDVLGYPKNQITFPMLYNSIHPDDVDLIIKASQKTIDFAIQHSETNPFEYVFSMDYRLKKADGQYIRVLRQTCMYKKDHLGNMTLTLAIYTDISHLKKSNVINFSVKGTDPNIITFPDEELLNYQKLPFTPTETKIIGLLAKGLCSKEIAGQLNISKLTVDKHRQNILHKSNLNNVAEMMVYAREHGVI